LGPPVKRQIPRTIDVATARQPFVSVILFAGFVAAGAGLREELWINVVKLLRAHGGCLGVRRL
jgi:hypothetical protein